MSDQDIFNTDNEPMKETPPVAPQGNDNGIDQMLGMIVNAEGTQKYASVEEALKGSAHAQNHIANLEKQVADLAKANESGSKIDDLIDTLQSQQGSQSPDDTSTPNGLSLADIQKVIRDTVNGDNEQATQSANIKLVAGKFTELYGEKASETLYVKAATLGFDKEGINSLIAKNPTAAMKILGVDEVKGSTGVNTDVGSVNTTEFQNQGEQAPTSSMGYISTKKLTEDWRASIGRTNERLNKN